MCKRHADGSLQTHEASGEQYRPGSRIVASSSCVTVTKLNRDLATKQLRYSPDDLL